VSFFTPAQLKRNGNALIAQHKFRHGFARRQKHTPKFILCHALYTKDKKVNLRGKNLAYLLYITIQPTCFCLRFSTLNVARNGKEKIAY